jgi:hypothetical protein
VSGDESKVELTISEEEFSRWLKPKRALDVLTDSMSYSAALNAVVRYLMSGMLRARADTVIADNGGERTTYPRGPIPRDAWDDERPSYSSPFWENGLFDWSDGFGHGGREFSAFDVRFDPAVVYKMAGREAPPVTTPEEAPAPATQMTGFLGPRLQDRGRAARPNPPPSISETPPASAPRRGGRPAGKYGEPIARITLRLAALPPEKLARYTAEALGLELIAEFKSLGLSPPSEDNAARDAAGILRVVRN